MLYDDNTAFDLTGATFAGVLFCLATTKVITLTGTWSITSATSGTFTYTPAAADVTEAGEWEIEYAVTISSQPTYIRDHVSITPRFVN